MKLKHSRLVLVRAETSDGNTGRDVPKVRENLIVDVFTQTFDRTISQAELGKPGMLTGWRAVVVTLVDPATSPVK